MNRPIRLGAEAEVEAIEAARWYETRRPGLGYDFLAALDETLERIRSNPHLGSRTAIGSGDDVRRLIMRRFPFDVVYMDLADRIHILAVAHERRVPGYWMKRI